MCGIHLSSLLVTGHVEQCVQIKQILAGARMSVLVSLFVLSGRVLCVGPITRLEESDCGVPECNREVSIMRGPWSTGGCLAIGKKYWPY